MEIPCPPAGGVTSLKLGMCNPLVGRALLPDCDVGQECPTYRAMSILDNFPKSDWICTSSFAMVASWSDQGLRQIHCRSVPDSPVEAPHVHAGLQRAFVVLFGASIMKRRFVLPSVIELSILATLAVL